MCNHLKQKKSALYNSKIEQPYVNISKNRKTSLYEFELPLENGGISYIDSDSVRINKNIFIFAKPNQIRHTQFPFKCSYVHISVFDQNLCNALSTLPSFIEIKERKKYEKIFNELQEFFVAPTPNDEIMKQSLILKLIYTLCTENELRAIEKKYSHTVNEAIEYIENNLSADLKLENVAKQVLVSPIHFHNCFKAATGKTLHEYVEEKRINKAIHLLLNTDMTLTEIAYFCGFSSQSYFSYAFKRKMNTTPRKYIKSLNSNYKI